MARLTGLSLSTVKRLETGGFVNPPLRYLVNYAQVLRVPLSSVIEPAWKAWMPFDAAAPGPPATPPPAVADGRPWPPDER